MQKSKLGLLRELMANKSIQAYIIPHNDAHDSEYLAETDERLAFISGFTGSNGLGLVTNSIAYLWTDSRYYIQAAKQLEQGWEMKKMESNVQNWIQYAVENLSGCSIGYDPLLQNVAQTEARANALKGISFVPIQENLIDKLWLDKPKEKIKQIIIHPFEFHQQDINTKRQKVFELAKKSGYHGDSLFIGKLDQIAWFLNLRGFDIEFNPLFKSYLHMRVDSGTLYINPEKISEEVKQYLKGFNIQIKDYEVKDFIENPLITKSEINSLIQQQLINPQNVALNPVEHLKALKTEREVQGFRESHIRDGAALVSYLAWLDDILNKGQVINEFDAANKLEEYRRKGKHNMGLSFTTISSSGANAAVVHYKPEQNSCSVIDPKEIYLVDSGGQYYDGTTDVTRTLHFTQSTEEQRNAYTRVLLGNLDLERVQFPEKDKIHGGDLDVLARRWLWSDKLTYGHGTGHGVGYFLNVHEGPQGISKYRTVVLEKGMIVSNEPGYYKEGSFGIRIENLIIVVDKGDEYLGFENITMCPYDRNLINRDLLSKVDMDYINQYHQKVKELILPLLDEDVAIKWLQRMTEPL